MVECVCQSLSCVQPTLCGLMDCRQRGSFVYGISQTKRLEWVVIPFSREGNPFHKYKPIMVRFIINLSLFCASSRIVTYVYFFVVYPSLYSVSVLPLAKPALIISRACCEVLVMCSCFHVGNLRPTLLCQSLSLTGSVTLLFLQALIFFFINSSGNIYCLPRSHQWMQIVTLHIKILWEIRESSLQRIDLKHC